MAWWIWVLIGLCFLMAEMLVPADFFLFFLGLAALVVGVGASSGLVESSWAQGVGFAVVSVAALVFLRKPLSKRWASPDAAPGRPGELLGDSVVLTDDLARGDVGHAELRGTVWSVRTTHDGDLEAGRRCRVDRVEGLVLWVSPESRDSAQ